MSRENPTPEEVPSWWPVPPEATAALGRALDTRLDEILPTRVPEAFRKLPTKVLKST